MESPDISALRLTFPASIAVGLRATCCERGQARFRDSDQSDVLAALVSAAKAIVPRFTSVCTIGPEGISLRTFTSESDKRRRRWCYFGGRVTTRDRRMDGESCRSDEHEREIPCAIRETERKGDQIGCQGTGRRTRAVKNIYTRRTRKGSNRGKRERERGRYRLFPGALVSDLAGNVSVGTREHSGQTRVEAWYRICVVFTRGRRPDASFRRSPTCGGGCAFPARRQSVSPDSRWEIAVEQPSFISGACSIRARSRARARARQLYCERLERN